MSNLYIGPEQWKQYRDTCYSLSDQGRFRNDKTGRILKVFHSRGENLINIHGHTKNLARALWETFRGPIPEGYRIRYKNGCSTMCDLYNLEIISEKESCAYASSKNRRIGTKIKDLNTGKIYKSERAAARALYVSRGCITSYFARGSQNSIVNLERVE